MNAQCVLCDTCSYNPSGLIYSPLFPSYPPPPPSSPSLSLSLSLSLAHPIPSHPWCIIAENRVLRNSGGAAQERYTVFLHDRDPSKSFTPTHTPALPSYPCRRPPPPPYPCPDPPRETCFYCSLYLFLHLCRPCPHPPTHSPHPRPTLHSLPPSPPPFTSARCTLCTRLRTNLEIKRVFHLPFCLQRISVHPPPPPCSKLTWLTPAPSTPIPPV